MTRRILLFSLLVAPALLVGAYTYYYSDSLTSINPTYWTTSGNVTATSNGLTAPSANGGSIISLVAAPTPPNEYEVKTTLRLTASGAGGTFVHYLRASADAMTGPAAQGTFYSFELSPTFNAQGVCSATLALNKRVGGSLTQISAVSGVPCHDGMEMRSIYSNGTMLVHLDGVNYMHISETTISAGQPGIGARATPDGNSFSSVSLGPHDGIAPDAVDRNTLAVTAFPTRVEMQWKGFGVGEIPPALAPPHTPQFLRRFGGGRNIFGVNRLAVQFAGEVQQQLGYIAIGGEPVRARAVIPLLVPIQFVLEAQLLDAERIGAERVLAATCRCRPAPSPVRSPAVPRSAFPPPFAAT